MEKFNISRAFEIATRAHEGQVDKAGVDYIAHPIAVSALVHGEEAKLVALLHDVVEDSELTTDDLLSMGCPDHIVRSIDLVTHGANYDGTPESYFKDIQRIVDSGDQNAIDVKFADLTHNSDRRRIDSPTIQDEERWAKYEKARNMLRPLISDYLNDI